MRRGLALLLVAALASGSCASAVRHPAAAAATVGFVLGFGTCEVDEGGFGACAGVGGIAALGLGGIAALVLLIAPTPKPVVDGEVIEDDEVQEIRARRAAQHRAHADAGVDAAPIDAATIDLDAAQSP